MERKAESKSEYWDGEMYARGGARRAHNVIAANVCAELRQQLRTRACETYRGDMRVRTTGGLYTYPDLTVVCGEPRFADGEFDTLLNPSLLVEIRSKSTETYGRAWRFGQYRAIESVQEYLMIASARMSIELYRQASGDWLPRVPERAEDEVELASCGCRLRLADVYEKVELGKTDAGRKPGEEE